MSTIDRERSRTLPPLVEGERLDRATFHERYEAMPPETRAELVGGVVVMMSPAGRDHADVVFTVASWLAHYRQGLWGVRGSQCATLLLDDASEPEPDLHLRIEPGYGGATRSEGGYVAGPPELLIEISRATRSRDLGPKRADYERAGVLEYLVVTLDPDEIHWFVRREGRLVPLPPGDDGVYRSEVFPGLWLDPDALFADDEERLIATVARGRATPAFAAFAAALEARRPRT